LPGRIRSWSRGCGGWCCGTIKCSWVIVLLVWSTILLGGVGGRRLKDSLILCFYRVFALGDPVSSNGNVFCNRRRVFFWGSIFLFKN
jgi:hypothetical protein